MLDVTALGELLIDFAPVGAGEDGYPTLAAKPGGAPPNYLAALAAYGAKTALLAKVGDDSFGRMLINTLTMAGIDTAGIVVDPAVFTTLAFVTLGATGERSFSFARKPGADTNLRFEELELNLIDSAKVFHFGTLSLTHEPAREATKRAVTYAKSRGKLMTFDPNLRASLWSDLAEAKKQILWGLGYADVVKISDEEIDFLWACSGPEGARRLLDDFGVKLAMVTMGAQGALLKNVAAEHQTPCPSVKPVDTTGAGDIFGGAAVSRLLKLGKMPEELDSGDLEVIARFAVTAASLSTQKYGGIPSVPREEEVLSFLETL